LKNNFKFYQDCIVNSLDKKNALPKFYIVLNDNEIIASYALLTNDIISRQDLYPWLACLFVNPEHSNKGIAEQLLIHGLQETKNKGFDRLYLSSDLENFYEKKVGQMSLPVSTFLILKSKYIANRHRIKIVRNEFKIETYKGYNL